MDPVASNPTEKTIFLFKFSNLYKKYKKVFKPILYWLYSQKYIFHIKNSQYQKKYMSWVLKDSNTKSRRIFYVLVKCKEKIKKNNFH